MNNCYDIAVVGAGPAAAVFAKELSEKRPYIKMLIIDGQTKENPKVCGGLLSPDAQKIFAKLNLTLPNSVLANPQIFVVETVDLQKKKVRYYQRHYLNMNRYLFDKWLLSLLGENVEIINGRCLSVENENEGYRLHISTKKGKISVLAKTLVGADGASSIVRKRLFNRKLYQYIAIQQTFEDNSEKVPYYSCIFDEKTSDSCSWTIRKDGVAVFGGAFKVGGCRKAFELQKQRFEDFFSQSFSRPLKTEACLVSSPRKWKDFLCGRENVYLIGEAAGFISASSFEGISSAVLSGKLFADAYCEGKNAREVLKKYKSNTLSLRIKLYLKTKKRAILCSPILRFLIMKSGIQSVKKYKI